MDEDLDYLRQCLERAAFVSHEWFGEDKNLAAFRSRERLIKWYCQPPGAEGEPYRDRGFYCRELAYLSRTIQPRTVVEFGTSLGIGTCLLHWLNPQATLVTVDINTHTYLPGNQRVQIGYLARHQRVSAAFVCADSQEYVHPNPPGVDLCLIDADHSYTAVLKDTVRAYGNVPRGRRWAMVWHDHNERHPGVVDAVDWFCKMASMRLQSRPDSDTVWVEGG